MKKYLKPLLIATSVAAAVGISAVSFAAWTAGEKTSTDNKPTGTTGVYTSGGITCEQTTLDKALIPYNQVGSLASDTTNNTFYWTITLKTKDLTADYKNIKCEVKPSSGFSFAAASALYYKIQVKDATGTPDAFSKPSSIDSTWTKLYSTDTTTPVNNVKLLGASGEIDESKEQVYTIYIIMDSSAPATDANNDTVTDRGFTFEFTLLTSNT